MTPIYLDYNATTPLDPRVFEIMKPYLLENFGNPSNTSHRWGLVAERAVEKARSQVADLLGCYPNELTFTSSSTESNNWVLWGLTHQLRKNNPGEKIHILTSEVEHSSVLKPLQFLKSHFDVEVDFLPVTSQGLVSVEKALEMIKPHTRLMSFIWVNNEIGTINPLLELLKLAQDRQILFHTDATQAVGKIQIDLSKLPIDFMSFSSHKIYGPKGAGVMYCKKSSQNKITPLIFGGGHERGQRSGTLNVPAIVGLGEACRILGEEMAEEVPRYRELQNLFWSEVSKLIPEARLNGAPLAEGQRAPTNLSLTLPQSFSVDDLQELGLAVSFGSACSTTSTEMSHVLRGIGLGIEQAQKTIRLSLGRWTTASEIKESALRLKSLMKIH